MSINSHVLTVTAAVAGLSISGVAVKDVDEMAASLNMSPKTLYPNAEGFVSETSISRTSLGNAGNSKTDHDYRLTYRYWHCAIGGGVGSIYEVFGDAITTIEAIKVALATNDALNGAIDIQLTGMSPYPIQIQDPAGNSGWGCDFQLTVKEYGEIA